ncbi:MAG: C40 family peptidase [Lachnospiraceae bacterium]|nr:C40 family peptidase [Lachnospiraceae bacterium]
MRKKLQKITNYILLAGLTAAVILPNLDRRLTVEATQAAGTTQTNVPAQTTASTQTTTSIRDVQNQIQDTQNQIDTINDKIDALLDEQSIIDEKIDDLNSEIINTMTSIDMKEEELAEKEGELAEKEARLAEMQVEISDAEEAYEQAKERQEQQYNDMLIRIRYMYENGNTTLLGMVLQGDGLSGLLNRMDYVEKVYEYDRNKLQEFEETKLQVQELWEALVAEEALLETEKVALETAQEQLEEDKRQLESQRSSLNTMLAQKKKESANYDAEINRAKQEAAVAAKLLKQEQQQLKLLQEEQNKPKIDTIPTTTDNTGTGTETPGGNPSDPTTNTEPSGNTNVDATDNNQPTENNQPDNTGDNQPSENNTGTSNGGNGTGTGTSSVIDSASGSELGKKIARYACQFVGNPYVPGGTSLTKGADCSGFTYRVYSDFGYTLPRTSYEQRSAGTAVDYSNAQPGDIICYDGHVAIYIGGGKIVHASTQKTGIKYGNATYRQILSVRRII